VLQFPGSCDERDAVAACFRTGAEARLVWHEETDLTGLDAIVVPGGFSYGDYLRAGAIARFSPAMESVAAFAAAGGPVLGICNGFQVLLEAGLLPGAVRVNRGLRYVCRDVFLRVENTETAFTRLYERGSVVRMPIGHMEGNYTAPPETLDALEREGRVAFRYCDADGRVTDEANPNGAAANIAGITNREGNVVGLMPHPDRCSEGVLGNDVGRKMFESAVHALAAR
jgi:phosphoribosylformylglycinamidine synthase